LPILPPGVQVKAPVASKHTAKKSLAARSAPRPKANVKAKVEPIPEPAAEPTAEVSAEPTSEPVVTAAEEPSKPTQEKAIESEATAQMPDAGLDPALALEEPTAPKKVAKAEKHVSRKSSTPKRSIANVKLAKGLFVVTKEACAMTSEPAADGTVMLTVKSSKKIWVENVDDNFVRAFNKAGDPGYISKDCVQ
jgi:hypothetical protein